MPNGTGKTTTLTLLRAALSGSLANGNVAPDEVRAYRKRNGGSDTGQFVVHLRIGDRKVSFILDFDFDQGSLNYHTTLPSGMKRGFHPPPDFSPFARKDFVQFFVFHGELAKQLISREHADAAKAIDDLFQLEIFLALVNRVEEYWEAEVEDRTATEERGLTRRRNRVRRLRERIDELVERRDELQDELEEVKASLERNEERFSEELEEQQEQQKKVLQAQRELHEAENRVTRVTEQILDSLKNPCAFHNVVVERLYNFKQSLDKVQLPESAAREFFVELAGQEECVCGRPLDDSTRATIEERAEQYLGSENVAFLNALKSQLSDQYEPDPGRHASRLIDRTQDLNDAVKSVAQLRTRRDAIEADAATGDPQLEQAREELRELRERKEQLKHQLADFEDSTSTGPDENVQGIAVLRKRLTEARQKLAEITDTLTLKRKRDALESILQRAHKLSREQLGVEIRKETNERIRTLMPDNPIRVERIDRCLVLEDQASGSTGENLTVAYAFLSTLFNRAEHRLPFVVDSPANPIDLEIRRQVGELVPHLGDQFIAFTISSERAGFLEPLEQTAPRIQYVTLFGSDNPKVDLGGMAGQDVRESKDGLVVHGRDFFWTFQVDEEA
jgi:predicted  nucleic acid-binding Zn-ribbon protein